MLSFKNSEMLGCCSDAVRAARKIDSAFACAGEHNAQLLDTVLKKVLDIVLDGSGCSSRKKSSGYRSWIKFSRGLRLCGHFDTL